MLQATTWAAVVATTSQSRIETSAAGSRSGDKAYAAVPSNSQAWSSQAMLSGASSSAPRWSVVGLTGKATPCSRDSSSRPPPDATAETTVSSRNATKAVGISSSTSRARSELWAPGSAIGTVHAATVSPPMIASAQRRADLRRTAAVRKRTR